MRKKEIVLENYFVLNRYGVFDFDFLLFFSFVLIFIIYYLLFIKKLY